MKELLLKNNSMYTTKAIFFLTVFSSRKRQIAIFKGLKGISCFLSLLTLVIIGVDYLVLNLICETDTLKATDMVTLTVEMAMPQGPSTQRTQIQQQPSKQKIK